MKALITGASSGMGADMARVLVEEGYEVILVARRKTRLEKLAKELGDKATIIVKDISSTYNCMELYNEVKKEDIDILINNAGFGVFGEFSDIDLNSELNMLDVNIRAVDMLCKFYLKDMIKKDRGIILNVSSSAAFMSGPLMSSYYASKSYVYRLSLAIREELRRRKSKVQISVLCPGPVKTKFNDRAGVEFGVKALSSSYVARYAVEKMFSGKTIIIPGFKMKFVKFIVRFLPDKFVTRINYNIQKKKGK